MKLYMIFLNSLKLFIEQPFVIGPEVCRKPLGVFQVHGFFQNTTMR